MAKKYGNRHSTTIKNFDEIGEVIQHHIYETVDSIDRAVGDGKGKLLKVYKTASKPIVEDIEIFMKQHELTEETWKSFNDGTLLVDEDAYTQFKLGFDLKKGGLAALFLEHGDNGSPKRMPNTGYHFMYYAVENNEQYFMDKMIDEFNKLVIEFRESKK